MQYVYILESNDAKHWYVGTTNDINRRLVEHNAQKSPHTSKFNLQWKLKTYVAFSDIDQSYKFEQYLKSHSGRAFARKRL